MLQLLKPSIVHLYIQLGGNSPNVERWQAISSLEPDLEMFVGQMHTQKY